METVSETPSQHIQKNGVWFEPSPQGAATAIHLAHCSIPGPLALRPGQLLGSSSDIPPTDGTTSLPIPPLPPAPPRLLIKPKMPTQFVFRPLRFNNAHKFELYVLSSWHHLLQLLKLESWIILISSPFPCPYPYQDKSPKSNQLLKKRCKNQMCLSFSLSLTHVWSQSHWISCASRQDPFRSPKAPCRDVLWG